MLKAKKALVTGATGFVGFNLVRRLAAEGWSVHCLVRKTSRCYHLKGLRPHVFLHVYDGQPKTLYSIMKTISPHVVVHLAAFFLARHNPEDIEPMIQSNISFPVQLIDAMNRCGVFNLICTGSYWQNYKGQKYSPVCLYAATKQAFNTVAQYYLETTPIKIVELKLFDVYGPNDSRKKLLYWLMQAAVTKKPLDMSPGDQFLDLVYIDDVISAYQKAADRLLRGRAGKHEIYSVSSRRIIKLKSVVRIFEKATGLTVPIRWGAKPYSEREVMRPWRGGQNLPRWKSHVLLYEGIRRTMIAEIRRMEMEKE